MLRPPTFPLILSLSSFAAPALAVPAFPGALGLGANATGGRGKPVYHVTNLNDSGPGSFRDAVSAPNRTIVFDVGGYITLVSSVGVKGNLTIAGETAPGGIAIRGREVSWGRQSNIICRFLRFRPGSSSPLTDNCLSFYRAKNIILDHCSLEFGKWNLIGGVSDAWQTEPVQDITVQRCILANAIGQQFGAHIECVQGTWSWYHNIFANGHNRQPLSKINTVFVNNTVYNYSAAYTTHTSTPFRHDIVNNCFLMGPASAGSDNTWFQVDKNQSIYTSGNLKDTNRDGVVNGSTTTPYWYQGTGTVLTSPWSPVTSAYTPLTAAQAVIHNNCTAGALPRDPMDELVISQVLTAGQGTTGTGAGTTGPSGGLYTSESQTGLADGGFGTLGGGIPPLDTDGDGMPDDWEAAKGLNLANAADGAVITASGYSNLELYLHWLTAPHAFVAKNTPGLPISVEMDLRPWVAGMPAGAAITVSGVTGGTVSQSGPGGSVVTFTPAVNTSGLAAFTFSVTSGGYTLTQTAGVLISPAALPRVIRWKGDGLLNAWNTGTANWTDTATGAASVFATGDRTLFDDSGRNTPSVLLNGTMTPGSVTVNAAQDYTFAGSGSLAGAARLTVHGPGALTLANTAANTFAGGTLIQGTTLYLGGGATLGSGPVTLAGGAALVSTRAAGSQLNLSASPLEVPADETGTVRLSPKMVLGAASGEGTLQVLVSGTAPVPDGTVLGRLNNYLTGPWSGFKGVVNITGAVPGAQLDLNINGGSFDHFGNAAVRLDNVKMQSRHNSSGNTIAFGSLDGTASATLGGSEYAGGATYSIGGRNEDCVFAGTIANGVSATSLTKTGSGRLTLSGQTLFTGTTTVSAGSLSGASAFAGPVVISGGSLSPGLPPEDVTGTMTAQIGLTFSGGTLSMDLSGSVTGANDKVTATGGTVTFSGTNTVKIKYTDGALGPGTYKLIDGNAGMQFSGTLNLSTPQPAGTRQTVSLSRQASGSTPAFVNLVVSGATADLTWSGASSQTWDLSTSQAWTSSAPGNPGPFYNLDRVNFTDSSVQRTVTLTGSLIPSLVKVSAAAAAHTFTGSGTLDGIARLEKSGGGTLTISGSGASTFTGGTSLAAGTLALNTTAATPLGTGVVEVSGGTLNLGNAYSLANSMHFTGESTVTFVSGNCGIVSATSNSLSGEAPALVHLTLPGLFTVSGPMDGFAGTLDLGNSGGTLRLNGNGNANYGSAAAAFALGTGSATLCNRNGGINVELGSVSGGPATRLQGRQSGSGATATSYRIGGRNDDATFAGAIVQGGDLDGLEIIKTGTGTWTLSGTPSWTGDLAVESGRLTISGTVAHAGDCAVRTGAELHLAAGRLTTAQVEIEPGASLTGCGTVHGTVVNHGTVRLDCPGGLAIDGDLENNGLLVLTGGNSLTVSGSAVNAGTIDLLTSPASTLPPALVNHGVILDAASLAIDQVVLNGSTLSFRLPAWDGYQYTVQTSAAVTAAWSEVTAGLTTSTDAAGVTTFTLTNVPAGPRFYRVAVER